LQGETEKGKITEHCSVSKAESLLQSYYTVQEQYPYKLDQIAFFYEQGWKDCLAESINKITALAAETFQKGKIIDPQKK
jgi:hypothetical protein